MEQMYCEFAALYDRLMADVDYAAWAADLHAHITARLPERAERGQPIRLVDCACGTGNVTIPLARMGYAVTGMDRSPDMLGVASEKAMAMGLRIPFVENDMRAFALHRPADVVTACCDGVNYLDGPADVQAFFAAANRALRPGGLLLFDVSSAYKLAHVLGANTFGEAGDACTYLWRNAFDPESRLLQMDLTFFVRAGGLYRRFDETHVQRAHSVEELDAWLTEAGFAVLEKYEAFTRNPPRADSERIQWVAQKL